MKFSFNELKKYFKEDLPDISILVDSLTNHAFEVDEVLKDGSDFMLDIKVLPDRASDAKNPLGMAREISAVLKRQLQDEYISYPDEKTARTKISFSVKDINDLIGHDFKKEEIEDFLKRVRVIVEGGGGELTALVPKEREDINIKEDLADEIARLYGYANLSSKALDVPNKKPDSNLDFVLENNLRTYFCDHLFTEIYGY